ncbi:uncharacterized protein LOC143531489 [Bidens hawaiensis]|uniref:uncharacterized protein LOC143531489 n=1 Tax=Bidens hawaiensis TaxID=980011 RepID=UPI00404A41A2
MDVKDHTRHTTHSGAYVCHRCGWQFPNPHPSAKHRRAHKKICGTIDGYNTNLGSSEVVSDDDKEKTPNPKIEKKMNIGGDEGDGGVRVSFSRSEDELFSDAVTEFPDSGSASKTLHRDLFLSFDDAENDEINKVDTGVEVSEKIDFHVEKSGEAEITTVCDSSESNLELTETGLVKDGVSGHTPESTHIVNSQESNSIDVAEAGEEKGQTSEISTEEAKDSELTKASPEVSAVVDEDHDNVKQGGLEKLGSSIAYGTSEERQTFEHVSKVVNKYETEAEVASEEIKHENPESDYKHALEEAKESAIVENVSVLTENEDLGAPNVQIEESFKEPVAVLTEKMDLETHELETGSIKPIQEVVKEPDTVLTEKGDLGGPHLEKQLNEQTHEVVETPISAVTEKQDLGAPELETSSKEQIQEVVEHTDTVSTVKEDLGGTHLEKQLNEQTREVAENPISVLTEKHDLGPPELETSSIEQFQVVVKQSDTVLTEKEDLDGPHLIERSNEASHEVVEKVDSVMTESQDLGALEVEKCSKGHVAEPNTILPEKEDFDALKSENCSKDEVIEQKVDNDSSVVADVSIDKSVVKDKNASDVVHVPTVEEGKMNIQDSGAALSVASSSRSSLEGNWGSVSVLSTASIDAGTLQSTEKSKVNSGKSNAATSDIYEPPSFMTLVETESKDKKPESSNAQDSQKPQNPEVSQAGWFPTMVKVNNESEGRKRNAEAIAKVTNWSAGKQSAPLKNLLGEAKLPRGAQPEPVVKKDEAVVNPAVNADVSSPLKLIDDDKKGKKKVKGISSWVPFVCCSSVNVVN